MHDWLEKAKPAAEEEISLKELDRLVKLGKTLSANLGEPFECVNSRLKQALDLQNRIYQTFKSNKTRNTISTDATEQAKKTPNEYFLEDLQRDLVAEARELKVTFKEIDELQDQLQKIQIWKEIVESWLNTKPEAKQRHKKAKLKNFLNEAKMLRVDDRPLPYGSPVWHRLASQLEYIEWLVKVEQLLTEFFPRTDVVEEGYEKENESIVMINANEDIHMQDDSAIIEIEGISFVAPVRCSKRLTLNQIAQLVEELEVKKFYDRTQSLRFKEQAPSEADSSMSIESDLSLEPKVFMPSQVNKFGFDLLPKAVKLLL